MVVAMLLKFDSTGKARTANLEFADVAEDERGRKVGAAARAPFGIARGGRGRFWKEGGLTFGELEVRRVFLGEVGVCIYGHFEEPPEGDRGRQQDNRNMNLRLGFVPNLN